MGIKLKTAFMSRPLNIIQARPTSAAIWEVETPAWHITFIEISEQISMALLIQGWQFSY